MARSRTRATKSLTTLKLTSASSSASRTSRMAASTSASLIRPRPVRLPSVLRSRSLRVSNMVRAGLRRGWWAGSATAGPGGTRVLTHRAGGVYRRVLSERRPADGPVGAGRAPDLCSALVRNPFASPLWRNQAFVRVWTAATISIFGSLITRIALPLVAILVLGSGRGRGRAPAQPGARRDARLRARRGRLGRPAAPPAGPHLGRPRAGGRCSARSRSPSRSASCRSPQLLIVSGLAAILTTFFDAADNAYLPTIVERERLVEANSALAASGSAAEFMAFGISGFLVQILTAPIAIAVDAVTLPRVGDPARHDPPGGAATAAARGPRAGPDRDPGRPPTRPPRPGPARVRRAPRWRSPRCGASSARRCSCSCSRTCS